MDYIGRISYSIFNIHWPLYCTLGLCIFINISTFLGYIIGYLFSVLISALITIMVAVAFYNTVDKKTEFICKKLKLFVK